jgi:hypothetical protein
MEAPNTEPSLDSYAEKPDDFYQVVKRFIHPVPDDLPAVGIPLRRAFQPPTTSSNPGRVVRNSKNRPPMSENGMDRPCSRP